MPPPPGSRPKQPGKLPRKPPISGSRQRKQEDDYTDPSTGKPYSDTAPRFTSRAGSVAHANLVTKYNDQRRQAKLKGLK